MPPGKSKKAKKPKQQTLEAALGQPRVKPPTIKKKKISTRSSTTSSPAAAAGATTMMATPTPTRQQQRQSISPARQLPASSAVFMPKISTAEAKKRTIVIDSDSDSDDAAPRIDDYYGRAAAGVEDGDLPVFSSQAVATVTHNPRTPRAASHKKKDAIVLDEDGDEDEDDMPLQSTQRTRGVKRQMAVLSEKEDEDAVEDEEKGESKDPEAEEDSDSGQVLSSAVRKRATRRGGDKLESSPAKKRRLISRRPSASLPAKEEEEESDTDISGEKEDKDEDEDDEDVKPRRLGRGRLMSSSAATSSPAESVPVRTNKRRVKKPMTEKEKARELLRRKRAGEPIDDLLNNEEEDEESEVELPKKGYYDTDSDNPALSEFEDEETDEEEVAVKDEKKKDKKKSKKKDKKKDKKRREISPDSEDTEDDDERNGNAGGSYEDEEMQDFIAADDSDAPIGAPDEVGIPIEFTRHAHKPLKEHFRDVVEWLVHYKVHPNFREKKEELYRLGWRKLDDEVRGLAQSKFASSAWKTDFYMALRARPYYTSGETHEQSLFASNCAACGRSGHPAKFEIAFSGSPYYKDFSHPKFLEPVPNDNYNSPASSADGGEDEDDLDDFEYDADGNTIPAPSRHWKIGSVCHSNAETAHNLLHWQYALLDWVDTRLSEDGHLAAAAAISKKRKEGETKEERKKRVNKKKYKLVAKVVSEWEANGTVKALFREFKSMLEGARNKSTAGPRGQKGWAR